MAAGPVLAPSNCSLEGVRAPFVEPADFSRVAPDRWRHRVRQGRQCGAILAPRSGRESQILGFPAKPRALAWDAVGTLLARAFNG